LATGGYGRVFFLSTNAMNSNVTAAFRAHRRGALFANPCFTQIHPTCIPVSGTHQSKLTLMSESLRNDGRVRVPKNPSDRMTDPSKIAEADRDYYLERRYPSFGNLVPRDVASRASKAVCDEGRGVGQSGLSVYLDFRDAIQRDGKHAVAEKYGNLFHMYHEITDQDPYQVPMRIFPAVHYTMGGLWVDYNLMSNIPGLHVLGEANFSDHGANRLGASALMQGLADGYFVIPYTLAHYIAGTSLEKVTTDHPAFAEAEASVQAQISKLLTVGAKGKRTVTDYYRTVGKLMWDNVGMARNETGLKSTIQSLDNLRHEFWENVRIPQDSTFNKELEMAGRVADFMELGKLMAIDALDRRESCGGHFREEMQTEEGEAKRDDENFSHVSAYEYQGADKSPVLHKEALTFENIHLAQRSYK
jgi:succinate dehydrogenase / fumarate reductase flavoprotein subunit